MDASIAIGSLSYLRDNLLRSSGTARKALDLAIAALEREHAERWRCVTKELPEIGIVQWCQVREAESRQAYIRNDGIWKDLQGRDVPVTHWRPMPEPAKEESRD